MVASGSEVGVRARVAMFLLGMCALVCAYATQPVLADIARWASVPEVEAAWTVSATTLGIAVTAPFAGAVSDRLGRKRVMLAAIAGVLVATVLCAFSPSFPLLLLFRFLEGVGTPFVFAVVVAYIGDEFAPVDAARLNGLSVAGTAFGGFAGRLLPGFAADLSPDWRAAFWPLVALLAIAFASTAAWLPEEHRFVPAHSFGRSLRGTGEHLRDPRILATCLVGAGLLLQQVAMFTFASLHLQAPPFALTTLQVGLVFAVMLAPVLVTPQVGRAIARFGRVPTFITAAAIGLVGIGLTLVPAVPAVVVGLTCSSVAVFSGQACATGFVGAHAAANRSAAVGLYLTAYYLGGTIGGIAPAPLFAGPGWPAVVALVALVVVSTTTVGALAWRSGPPRGPAARLSVAPQPRTRAATRRRRSPSA